jgi:flagellar protein FliS
MFPTNSSTALNAYRNVGLESGAGSGDPHQLVLMLFNGARAALAQAKGHLERREIAAKGMAISKAISIIDGGLKASLDLNVGGELAKDLSDLYVYMGQRLLYANLKNDAKVLAEVAGLLAELGGAWEAIAPKPAPARPAAHAPADGPAQANRVAPASAPPANRVAAAYGVL